MKKFIRFLGFLLMLTLIFNSVAFAEEDYKFRQVKVTRDTNLGLPVYMEIGIGLTNLYMPMASGVTTLGIANIPTDQTKARFSAIGLAGHCTYHNEYHSINDLGNGGITIQ